MIHNVSSIFKEHYAKEWRNKINKCKRNLKSQIKPVMKADQVQTRPHENEVSFVVPEVAIKIEESEYPANYCITPSGAFFIRIPPSPYPRKDNLKPTSPILVK